MKTERNTNKQKPSTINVLEISERLTSENEEKGCDHSINKRYWKRLTLTCNQKEQIKALIKEDSSVFLVNDGGIDNVTPRQMEIDFNDKTPVQ